MARVFTTSFPFNHRSYNAIVTVLTHPDQTTYRIKLMDLDLFHFVPNGEITFNGLQGYEQVETLNNTIAQSIIRSVVKSIERHLSLVF